MLNESVRMYVINPFSYKACAMLIARAGENPQTLEAACCSELVMNGARALRCISFSITRATCSELASSSARISTA